MIDPPTCVPIAVGNMRAATAAAEPEDEPNVTRVLVLVAMEEEAAPFIEAHSLAPVPADEIPWHSGLPLVAYTGQVEISWIMGLLVALMASQAVTTGCRRRSLASNHFSFPVANCRRR